MAEAADHIVPLIYYDATQLARSANVGIIGGGIMGTSIAFHLAEAGVRDIVLIERDTLGSGSSAKPLGGVRATFSDPGNIELGQRSLEIFERFHEVFRTDIGLQQWGTCSCVAMSLNWLRWKTPPVSRTILAARRAW